MAGVNVEWLKNLKKQIDAIPDCRALNELIKFLKEIFEQFIMDILNKIAKMVGLIIPPTSLSKIIKYLKNLAMYYLGPYLAAIIQLAQIIKAFAEVLKAIQEKLSNLHCSVSPKAILNQMKESLKSKAYEKIYGGKSSLGQLLDIATKLKGGVPPLNIIASSFGVNIDGLPALADQYGGTLPFMQKMLEKYEPATVPEAPTMPIIPIPNTEVPLEAYAPTIDWISTNIGLIGGQYRNIQLGTVIYITGSNFREDVSVYFGELLAPGVNTPNGQTVRLSSTLLRCVTPLGGSVGFPVDIRVINNEDLQEVVVVNAFSYVDANPTAPTDPAPVVTGITVFGETNVTSGPAAGGTDISIFGTGFLAGAIPVVGVPCTDVVVYSSTEIRCKTAAHAAGIVSVVVKNPNSAYGYYGSLADAWTYV